MARSDKPRLVNVDGRGRISLGWTRNKANYYAVTVEPDGTIILTPIDISSEGIKVKNK